MLQLRLIFAIILAAPLLSLKANAHSGGTDQYGCHTQGSTGSYHCHGRGASARTSGQGSSGC